MNCWLRVPTGTPARGCQQAIAAVLGFWLALASVQAMPAAPSWRSDAICGAPLPAFVATTVTGCAEGAFCAFPDPLTRVCACPADGGNTRMQLDYRGLQVKTWWTEVSPVSLGPASFRLDGFGRTSKGVPQALLGVKHDQSSGMAVQSWSVWAIAEGQRSAEIQLEDYGLISFATRPKDRSNCQLLASQWRPGDQGGLFAVAQWHEMRKGQWLPSRDRPVITRRYLYRFEKQRMNSQNANRPLRWYAHPDTHPRH